MGVFVGHEGIWIGCGERRVLGQGQGCLLRDGGRCVGLGLVLLVAASVVNDGKAGIILVVQTRGSARIEGHLGLHMNLRA